MKRKIYELIIEDMEKKNRNYSHITNMEISNSIGLSAFSVRDHITSLIKSNYLQRVNNYWDETQQFHNRVLYKGSKSME